MQCLSIKQPAVRCQHVILPPSLSHIRTYALSVFLSVFLSPCPALLFVSQELLVSAVLAAANLCRLA